MRYERPRISDFGSIAAHTFGTPGGSDKSGKEKVDSDMFGEATGAPAGSAGAAAVSA